jgi:hypothetical protein
VNRFFRPASSLYLACALLLAACGRSGGQRVEVDQGQRQAVERARALCQDLGYAPGTVEFARCAQSEFDRYAPGATAATAAAPAVAPQPVPSPAPVQAARPQPATAPTPAADSADDDWLVRWMKRPNVCQAAACSAR